MKTKTKPKVSKAIVAKAKQVLQFAESKAKEVADWLELHSALYDVEGKATQLFPTEAERSAFMRTNEYKRINAMMDTLPQPAKTERSANLFPPPTARSVCVCRARSMPRCSPRPRRRESV